MNRLIQIFAVANAILFSFLLPFTAVYSRQEKMYANNEKIELAYEADDPKPLPVRPSVQSISSVDLVSAEYAPQILPKIAECESGNDPRATSDTSSAKGLLQILDGTWKSFNCTGNVFSADDNMRCGLKIATKSGLHHWNPSRSCWSRYVVNDLSIALK